MKQRGVPGFHLSVQFSGVNANLNTSLLPFLPSLSRFLRPSDALLQIYWNILNINILQILTHFFLYSAILTCF